jgi:hypothetical protein
MKRSPGSLCGSWTNGNSRATSAVNVASRKLNSANDFLTQSPKSPCNCTLPRFVNRTSSQMLSGDNHSSLLGEANSLCTSELSFQGSSTDQSQMCVSSKSFMAGSTTHTRIVLDKSSQGSKARSGPIETVDHRTAIQAIPGPLPNPTHR